jgi:hypothetical protein
MTLLFGAACAAVALAVMACSGKLATVGSDGGQATGSSGATGGGNGSSNGGVTGSSGASSSGVGSSSNGGSSGSTSSGSGGPIDDAGVFDAGINCGSMPTLHPSQPGDIFCGLGADGGAIQCLASFGDGMCCLGGKLGNGTGGYAPDMCSPNAMVGCPNGGEDAGGTAAIGIQCNQVADCTANGFQGAGSCCLQGATVPTVVPGCGYVRSKGGTAIVCETNAVCAAGEVQICSSNVDCPQGTTCTAGKWKIFQLGFCQ